MTQTREIAAPEATSVTARLSTPDRYLPLWIAAAMTAGLLAGRLVPGLATGLDAVAVDGVSLPIALGLLVMMYPVLAKVRYDRLHTVTGDRRLLAPHRRDRPRSRPRLADDRLRAAAKIEGITMPDIPEVLFVCVHNAGRSQMAAALLDHHAAGRVTVRSAGSTPASEINPAVIEAMTEIGIDLSKEFPKPLTDEAVRAADVVITMGCGDACPVYPGKRYLDWDLTDPAGQDVDTVRGIRDQIDTLVQQLLTELVSAPR